MADVRMSQEVRATLGPQMVAEASAVTLAGGRCVACRQPLNPAKPVNAMLAMNTQIKTVGYAHPECADSVIVQLPEDQTDVGLVDDDGSADMAMTAGVLPVLGPVLVAELAGRLFTESAGPGSDLTSPFTAGLLGIGFTLVGSLDQEPAPLDEWIAVVSAEKEPAPKLIVLTPEGQIFWRGMIEPPEDWLDHVRQIHTCTLLVGDVGLPDLGDTAMQTQLDALATTAARGRLVGGRIRCGHPADFGLA